MSKLTDAQRRDILTARLMSGAIDGAEWSRRMSYLDRRYKVIGWTFIGVCALGALGMVLAFIGAVQVIITAAAFVGSIL